MPQQLAGSLVALTLFDTPDPSAFPFKLNPRPQLPERAFAPVALPAAGP